MAQAKLMINTLRPDGTEERFGLLVDDGTLSGSMIVFDVNGVPSVLTPGTTTGAVSQTQTALTDSTGGSATTTLAAITTFTPSVAWNGSSVYPSAADATSIAAAQTSMKNSLASLAAELALAKADVASLVAAVNLLRTSLRAAKIMA